LRITSFLPVDFSEITQTHEPGSIVMLDNEQGGEVNRAKNPSEMDDSTAQAFSAGRFVVSAI
jgi:hypothetical protein